jgi:hypothetical protein
MNVHRREEQFIDGWITIFRLNEEQAKQICDKKGYENTREYRMHKDIHSTIHRRKDYTDPSNLTNTTASNVTRQSFLNQKDRIYYTNFTFMQFSEKNTRKGIRYHGSFSGKPVRRVKAEPYWTGKNEIEHCSHSEMQHATYIQHIYANTFPVKTRISPSHTHHLLKCVHYKTKQAKSKVHAPRND